MVEDSQETTHFGFQTVAKEQKADMVAHVFHSVAAKYDVMNDLMSFGIHRLWKRFTIDCSGVRRGQTVLDLAGGTGDLTAKFSRLVGETGRRACQHGSRLRWASVHHSTSAGGSVYGRDGTRHLSAENEAGIFLIITSVADQARLIHTAGGALSNEHFIWHPVTRSVRKCNSSKICRTVQAAGVAE